MLAHKGSGSIHRLGVGLGPHTAELCMDVREPEVLRAEGEGLRVGLHRPELRWEPADQAPGTGESRLGPPAPGPGMDSASPFPRRVDPPAARECEHLGQTPSPTLPTQPSPAL